MLWNFENSENIKRTIFQYHLNELSKRPQIKNAVLMKTKK